LEDLLEPGIRKPSVADEDAQAAGVEKRPVNVADVVDDTGHPDGIVRPAPVLAVDRGAARDCAVDVGKVPRRTCDASPAYSASRKHAGAHQLRGLIMHQAQTNMLELAMLAEAKMYHVKQFDGSPSIFSFA